MPKQKQQPIDQHGELEGEPFGYKPTKDGQVFLQHHGRTVVVLAGKQAERFLQRSQELSSLGLQLLIAKATGNFKRGNEKRR